MAPAILVDFAYESFFSLDQSLCLGSGESSNPGPNQCMSSENKC